MAMLQRRFASSVYAVRRSLERMQEKREKILADPEGYRQDQLLKRVPDDFDELPEDEQQSVVVSILRREIGVMALSALVVVGLLARAAGTA